MTRPICPGGNLYTVAAGDTLSSIAHRFDVSERDIIDANRGRIDPDDLRVGQIICIPSHRRPERCPRGFTEYVIRSGDTFFSIARRFGTTVEELTRANPGVRPTRLTPGQRICVPRRERPKPDPSDGLTDVCCVTLHPVDRHRVWGSALFAEFERDRLAVTFTGVNLPRPGTLDDFDAFVGTATDDQGRTHSVTLERAADDLDTWCGTTVIGEREIEDVTIRAVRRSTGALGPVVLRGDAEPCFRRRRT